MRSSATTSLAPSIDRLRYVSLRRRHPLRGDGSAYAAAISDAERCLVSAVLPTRHAWFSACATRHLSAALEEYLQEANAEVVAFTAEQARAAYDAYRRFGKGTGHPAGQPRRLRCQCFGALHWPASALQGSGFRAHGCAEGRGQPGLSVRLARTHCTSSASLRAPSASRSIVSTQAASSARSSCPFSSRKSSSATSPVRLLPSMNGWFLTMPRRRPLRGPQCPLPAHRRPGSSAVPGPTSSPRSRTPGEPPCSASCSSWTTSTTAISIQIHLDIAADLKSRSYRPERPGDLTGSTSQAHGEHCDGAS